MVGPRRSPPPVGVGMITVFTVLLVLTLSVFSALTLTSARADLALSQTNAETVSAYYAADARAAELYAQFKAGTDPELSAQIEISDKQALLLKLRREDGEVRVLSWRTVPTEAAFGLEDDTLPLFTGELPD